MSKVGGHEPDTTGESFFEVEPDFRRARAATAVVAAGYRVGGLSRQIEVRASGNASSIANEQRLDLLHCPRKGLPNGFRRGGSVMCLAGSEELPLVVGVSCEPRAGLLDSDPEVTLSAALMLLDQPRQPRTAGSPVTQVVELPDQGEEGIDVIATCRLSHLPGNPPHRRETVVRQALCSKLRSERLNPRTYRLYLLEVLELERRNDRATASRKLTHETL